MGFRQNLRLIGEDGKPNFGTYRAPLQTLNLENFRLPGDPQVSKFKQMLIRRFRIKKWQFLGVFNPEIIFGVAVVHLGYLSNCFAYLYHQKTKTLHEYDGIQPLAGQTRFEGSLHQGTVLFVRKDLKVRIANQPAAVHLTVDSNTFETDLTFRRDLEPFGLVSRVGLKGFNYTHKEAGIPVNGVLGYQNESYTMHAKNAFGVLDYTTGYLGRRTFWNWAAGAGLSRQGARIGFNLAQGINETGRTENVFWINGAAHKVDVADFAYQDLNLQSPWKIRSADGQIDLTFYPSGERKANLNLLAVASRFHQLFGHFSGKITQDRHVHTFQGLAGFTEEHESVW